MFFLFKKKIIVNYVNISMTKYVLYTHAYQPNLSQIRFVTATNILCINMTV